MKFTSHRNISRYLYIAHNGLKSSWRSVFILIHQCLWDIQVLQHEKWRNVSWKSRCMKSIILHQKEFFPNVCTMYILTYIYIHRRDVVTFSNPGELIVIDWIFLFCSCFWTPKFQRGGGATNAPSASARPLTKYLLWEF